MNCTRMCRERIFEYLRNHEIDIAYEENDFGTLKLVFMELFGREPTLPKTKWEILSDKEQQEG